MNRSNKHGKRKHRKIQSLDKMRFGLLIFFVFEPKNKVDNEQKNVYFMSIDLES